MSFGSLFPFRILLPIYVAVLIVAISLYGIYKIQIPEVTAALFGFIILGMVGTLQAIPAGISVKGAIVFSTRLLLLFGIILTLNTRRWVYRGWMVLFALVVLSFGVAMIEISTGWHWAQGRLATFPDIPPYSNWASAWYYNINDFSFFVVIGTIPALILALKPATNYRTRILFAIIWIIGVIITFRIYSRAAVLTQFLVIITAVALVRSHDIRGLLCQIPLKAGKVTLPTIGCFLAGVFYTVPNPINDVGSSLWIRWQLQKAAILEGGIIGQGLGSASAIIGSSSINTGFVGDLAAPHSWYAAIISETGMLGLILFLTFYGGLLTKLVRKSDMNDPIPIIGVTALIALPVAGLGPSNALRLPTWWIVIGLSVSTCKQ
mgnify:FL=1